MCKYSLGKDDLLDFQDMQLRKKTRTASDTENYTVLKHIQTKLMIKREA